MTTFFGLKTKSYPLDPTHNPDFTAWETLFAPHPRYPFNDDNILRRFFSQPIFAFSLNPVLPFAFSLIYYILAHSANSFVKRIGNKDYTKGPSFPAKLLRFLILVHNAGLAVYSGWTFAMMFPYVVDFFLQGYKAAGYDGVKLALCSMPTNCPHLGKYAYLFYLSKYYEVFDSVILLLKGKRVSNLQSYHHAGAIICMWIAYRYQSQPVWVFCVFNSFVHTFMYTYYLFSALRLPFPRVLKRNLTTMQIAQIALGTFLTNLYLFIHLRPSRVVDGFKANRVVSWYQPNATKDESVFIHALVREASNNPSSCVQTTGAELALHVNTMYMFPLLALFFNFFMRSYLQKSSNVNNGDANKGVAAKEK
ncbi:related to ELO1 - Elongase I [Melanopsichium pennsylvanicum]|uniref:Elongation of fatty acids protein n=2 Tax=Melanopsichium pennsylvanicum TaxID=63383 RepID=A0AAJ4XP57_9BASI|nr:fatty acid elongase-like protein [Melanopsichium pennsylvanicum 4]SNX85371.1 related to ELO1 - Elongase I [Melanopsichium pennsylvanicum]